MTSNRWLILAVLFLARTAMGFQFQSVASVSPFLIEGLAIDYAMLGTLIGIYKLPGILFALPGGMLGKRFGDKPVVLAGLLRDLTDSADAPIYVASAMMFAALAGVGVFRLYRRAQP